MSNICYSKSTSDSIVLLPDNFLVSYEVGATLEVAGKPEVAVSACNPPQIGQIILVVVSISSSRLLLKLNTIIINNN